MAKSVEEKITAAKAALTKAKGGEGEDSGAKIRKARKSLKRAQRRAHVTGKTIAKRDDQEKRRQANIDKIKEKEAKKQAAGDAAAAAAAQAQAEAATQAASTEEAAPDASAEEAAPAGE